jgi:ADP-heptose:LPS heptosyltransferase
MASTRASDQVNIRVLRWLDRWVGLPLCAALTLWRKLSDRLARATQRDEADPRGAERILFVKLAEQGSTVLAHAALADAVARVGRENVSILVLEDNRFILDVLDVLPAGNVITVPARGGWALLRGLVRAIGTLRRARMSVAIDLEFFTRASAILCFLSGAPRRVGLHAYFGESRYRGDLMTHRIAFNPSLHASDLFRVLVAAIDLDPATLPTLGALPEPAPAPQFQPRAEDLEDAKRLLGDVSAGPIVLLNANCGDLLPLRQWPGARYVELARRLLARFPEIRIVFTGSASERSATERLVRAVGDERCQNLAGETTLRQLLALCTLAELMVTNDSGPAHFATLTPIDVVTLFGPETPHVFGARSPRNHVFWARVACSPCVNALNDRQSACRNNVCMQEITVPAVFEEACAILVGRLAARRALAR